MPQHVQRAAGGARRADGGWRAALAWHDRRPRATMSSFRGWMWAALVAASFFWMSNPIVFVFAFEDSVEHTITWTLIVVLLSLPWLRLPRLPWPWVTFLTVCAASLVWTIDPVSTGDSIRFYLVLTALAAVVAANCEAEVVGWGMGLGGVTVVVLSIYAFEKTMWGSSYLTSQGSIFAGVGTNENILAYTLALALAAALALGRPQPVAAQALWAVVLGVHAYGLYLASSGTGYIATLSLLLCAAVVVLWPRLRGLRRRVVVTWAAGLTALLVLALLVVTIGLDKELATVSGRTPFWRATIATTLARTPFLGSGWGAVWPHPWLLAPPNSVADEIYARAGYPLAHGHNFFVDVLPELGILGVLLAGAIVAYAVREVRTNGLLAGCADPAAGRLVLLVLVSLLVSGVSEPMLTVPLGWWSLTLVVALTRQRARVSVRAISTADR